ncbi:hypothetical protein GCM10028804_19100 [Larkinella terrae]
MIDSANALLKKAGKDTMKIARWCACDSSLILLEGKDLDDLKINGRELADGTRPSGGVSGDPPYDISFNSGNNTLIWPQLIGESSLNYVTQLPYEPANKDAFGPNTGPFTPTLSPNTTTPFIIAITDTGIRPGPWLGGLLNFFWVNPNETPGKDIDRNGMKGDMGGWNFINNSPNLYDSVGHGTRVSSLIHEQLTGSEWAQRNVRFMFLKTFKHNGKGILFDNLCAMSYARQKGAKIINASWGYYNPSQSKLLAYFIKELSSSGVLVVAAAGNADSTADASAKLYWGVAPNNLRNSGLNPFWPACFSGSFSNVITATTLNAETKVALKDRNIPSNQLIGPCGNQNYSASYVNIGVLNNQPHTAGSAYSFCQIVDILNQGKSTSGSSYAAPVVTGKIAAYAGPNWSSSKDILYQKLLQTTSVYGSVLKTDPKFVPFTTNGFYVFREDK